MKKIELVLDDSILNLADVLLGQDHPEEEPQELSIFSGEDPPTLHDLFDVVLGGDHPDYSPDVNLIFPTAELEQAEAENEEEVRCETPVVQVDLECNESMISTTPEGSVGSPEREEPEEGPSSRWGPLEPGESPRPCRDCTYHRVESGDPSLKCGLCYMKDTYYQVYSPVSPATPLTTEEDVVNDQPEEVVTSAPSSPVAEETGRGARRRPAEAAEPLDLSLPKRRRQQ
ncbi:E1A [Bat mastadenovirus WIV9]|uniref:E1A n=1 Tax=Bat mastadenovirus WIV9 TaxID=1788436 RepID=A0A163HBM8_9ADEN|nr:E1A [Bat mastadenovirus WIV9]AMB43044.1 E1A [Bat mastadenovirus WIV9]